jgi:hypothetical protein
MKTLIHISAALLSLFFCASTWSQGVPNGPSTKMQAKPSRTASPPKKGPLLPPATQEQLDAAERTYFGDYECEFNQKIHVSLAPQAAGYIEVKHLNKVFIMKPVVSSTGALRLEDVRGQTLLLQIANKSMLMDVKVGQRIVDSCVHATQTEFIRTAPPATSVLN